MSGGFNDPEGMGLIGDDKADLSGKESFSGAGFNDGAGDLPIDGKQEVNGSDKTQAAGFNDSDSIIDSGHMSG